jgi:hypothetical protein
LNISGNSTSFGCNAPSANYGTAIGWCTQATREFRIETVSNCYNFKSNDEKFKVENNSTINILNNI